MRNTYEEYFYFDPNYTYSESNLISWDKEVKDIFKYEKKRTSIIDIGSSMGDFLKVAQKYYKNCVGLEVAVNVAEFTKEELKVKVHLGSYVDIGFDEKFSCINMSHVIKHIPNPTTWIQKTRELLDEEGILAMSVPNMHSLDKRFKFFLKRIGLTKGKWKDNLRTPDHLFEPIIRSPLRFFRIMGLRYWDIIHTAGWIWMQAHYSERYIPGNSIRGVTFGSMQHHVKNGLNLLKAMHCPVNLPKPQ